jgi:hypothetical protein
VNFASSTCPPLDRRGVLGVQARGSLQLQVKGQRWDAVGGAMFVD